MDHDAIDPTVGTVRASSLFIYLFFFLLFFFCFVLVRQLEHPHSVLIVVMTVFFSDAGCIGLQGFLEDPMWTRASSQDKPPVLIANMMTDPTTVLVRQLEHRQHSSMRHSTMMPLTRPLAFDSFFAVLCRLCIDTFSSCLQYLQ